MSPAKPGAAASDLRSLASAVADAKGVAGKVDALNALAYAARNLDSNRSRASAEEAWRLARSADYRPGIAWGNLLRGFTRKQSGRFVDAFTCGREALEGFRALRDARGEAIALRFIGGVYVSLLDLPKARDYYRKSLALFERVADPAERLLTLAAAANVNLDLGDAAGALGLLAEAARRARALGDRNAEIMARLGAGIAHRQLAAPAAALAQYRAALRLAVADRNPRREAEALILIGEHQLMRKRFAAARAPYARALALGEADGNLINRVNARNGLGEVALAHGELADAEAHFSACLKLGRRSGNPDGRILGLTGLSGVRLRQSRREEAGALAAQAVELARASGYPDYLEAANARLREAARGGGVSVPPRRAPVTASPRRR